MEDEFDELINGYLDHQVGVKNEFISQELSFDLINNLESLFHEEKLRLAGVGNKDELAINKKVRSDKIFWLDKKDLKKSEQELFAIIDSFVIFLNRSCFAGIKSYEFHYALYEEGAFYKKHIDQFKTDQGRAFSMIIYLNEGWVKKDGGELKVYKETEVQLISPENQKCVFFKSDKLAHEVLVTNKSRMSITGWLKK
jgi:SM-20-related protein